MQLGGGPRCRHTQAPLSHTDLPAAWGLPQARRRSQPTRSLTRAPGGLHPLAREVLTSPLSCPGQFLFDRVEGISKATIVDLDAHQVSAQRGWGLPLPRRPLTHGPTRWGSPPPGTPLSPRLGLCCPSTHPPAQGAFPGACWGVLAWPRVACPERLLCPHQGNGHERDFMGDKRVYIMDVYNRHIYPGDRFAKRECPPTSAPA